MNDRAELEERTELLVNLTKPVKYMSGGSEVEGTFITLKAPTASHFNQLSDLKQMMFRIFDEETSGEEQVKTTQQKGEIPDIKAKAILGLVYSSKTIDLKDFIKVGQTLLVMRPNLALIDGVVPLNNVTLGNLSPRDQERLIAEYVAFFILPLAFLDLLDES